MELQMTLEADYAVRIVGLSYKATTSYAGGDKNL